MVEALLKATRCTLDAIKKRLTTRVQGYDEKQIEAAKPAFFSSQISLNIPNIVMVPALDEIQQALNKSMSMILGVSKNIVAWGQDRSADPSQLRNYFQLVSENKDVTKFTGTLTSAIHFTKKEINDVLDGLAVYNKIWKEDRDEKIKAFVEGSPDLFAFEAAIKEYEATEKDIKVLPVSYRVGSVELETEAFKQVLVVETNNWKQAYGRALNHKAHADMTTIFSFCGELNKSLGRKLNDLDDIRTAMASLKELRDSEIRIDSLLGPVEQSYALLHRFEVPVKREEIEHLDTLTFTWTKVLGLAYEVQEQMIKVQPKFRANLDDSVVQFQADVDVFSKEYRNKGPMVSGIPPQEASDRLSVFQMKFDELWRKYTTYSGGEELFGLPQK